MTFNYTRDIPDGPHNPSSDQPPMKINTNAIDDLIAVDHRSFNLSNGGYHTIIHQDANLPSRTWNPVTRTFNPAVAAIAGVNQILTAKYTPNYTGAVADTQLFAMTGAGGPSQITGINGQTDGWAWCSGILIQWGQVTFVGGNSHLTGTVTFKDRAPIGNIPFPSTCFMVNATLKIANTLTTTASNTIAIRDFTATQFRWVYNSSSSSGSTDFPGFYWIATGI